MLRGLRPVSPVGMPSNSTPEKPGTRFRKPIDQIDNNNCSEGACKCAETTGRGLELTRQIRVTRCSLLALRLEGPGL